MIWIILAVFLDRAQIKIAGAEYGSKEGPGIGSIDDVLSRRATAPHAYRVLVPFLIGVVERLIPKAKPYRLTLLYEPIKIGLMAFALYSVFLLAGLPAALVVGVGWCAVFLADYWDTYIETAAFALALAGEVTFLFIAVLVMVAASRETSILVPFAYLFMTGDLMMFLSMLFLVGAILLSVRFSIGKRPLNCDRIMIRQNWKDLRSIFENRPWYLSEIFMTLIISVLSIAALIIGVPAWPVLLVLLVAGWVFGRAAETRVFAPCLIWISIVFVGGIR